MDSGQQEQKKKIEIDEVEQGELIASTHEEGTLIYRAYYEGKEYALKSVLRDSIETHLQLEHLMNERNALRELSHPGINKMIDTIKDDQYLHFLLEIVYGIPLHKLLQMRQSFTKSYVQLIAVQIIKELQYLHSMGYVYRDLKASNIIVDQYGKTTLIDLGYIKKIDNDLTNSFCGTIHMIAPELYNDNLEDEGYSYLVDVYSIGILLYELTVGSAPFGYKQENSKEKVLLGLTDEIKNKIKGDQNLLDLVTQLLNKDPYKRPLMAQILEHEYFNNVDVKSIEVIMNGEQEQVSQEIKNKFDIFKYQEDIQDFGINPQLPLTEEEKKINDKFNNLFSNF